MTRFVVHLKNGIEIQSVTTLRDANHAKQYIESGNAKEVNIGVDSGLFIKIPIDLVESSEVIE